MVSLETLGDLNLRGNNIHHFNINKLFKNCHRLQSLGLSENKFDNTSLNDHTFQEMPVRFSFEKLKLSNNRLTHLLFFRHLVKLREIDCSHYSIESIYDHQTGLNLFGQLMHLQRLDLSWNMIREMREDAWSHYEWQIEYLDLSGNPLDETVDESYFDKLRWDLRAEIKTNALKGTKRKI